MSEELKVITEDMYTRTRTLIGEEALAKLSAGDMNAKKEE